MRISRFEDLVAWQKARVLTRQIYEVTERGGLGRDFSLKDQMRRCAVSIMANIAEGFERSGLPEFQQYLSVAKASRAELRSHLYVAQDVGYLKADVVSRLLLQAEEVGRIVGGLRTAVERERRTSRLRDGSSTQDSGLRTQDSSRGS
jgi:four helix bundle protein